MARQSSAKACTAVRIRSVPQTPPFQEGFFIQYCFFIFMLMEKAELIILQFTLLPIVAWVFLWGYDKLEHVLLHKYFEWTLRVERPQRPLKESFKKLFRLPWYVPAAQSFRVPCECTVNASQRWEHRFQCGVASAVAHQKGCVLGRVTTTKMNNKRTALCPD